MMGAKSPEEHLEQRVQESHTEHEQQDVGAGEGKGEADMFDDSRLNFLDEYSFFPFLVRDGLYNHPCVECLCSPFLQLLVLCLCSPTPIGCWNLPPANEKCEHYSCTAVEPLLNKSFVMGWN